MSQFDLDDEEDNALLAAYLEDVERGFDFLLTPHLDRRVRRLGVRHRNYVGRLMQRGGGSPLPIQQQQILNRQMEEALERAMRQQILNDPEVHPNDIFSSTSIPIDSETRIIPVEWVSENGSTMISEPGKSCNKFPTC